MSYHAIIKLFLFLVPDRRSPIEAAIVIIYYGNDVAHPQSTVFPRSRHIGGR